MGQLLLIFHCKTSSNQPTAAERAKAFREREKAKVKSLEDDLIQAHASIELLSAELLEERTIHEAEVALFMTEIERLEQALTDRSIENFDTSLME